MRVSVKLSFNVPTRYDKMRSMQNEMHHDLRFWCAVASMNTSSAQAAKAAWQHVLLIIYGYGSTAPTIWTVNNIKCTELAVP